MLDQMRGVVCRMWEVAESLDNMGVGKLIPFISDSSDVRHAMKGEMIIMLYDIVGTDKKLSREQVEYLRYVLHAPIKYSEQEDYARWVRNEKTIRENPLTPYILMIDKETDMELAKVYLELQASLAVGYLKCCGEIDVEMMIRYTRYMKRIQELIELSYGKKLDYNPLDFLDDEKRIQLSRSMNLHLNMQIRARGI